MEEVEVHVTDYCECDCFDPRDSCNGVFVTDEMSFQSRMPLGPTLSWPGHLPGVCSLVATSKRKWIEFNVMEEVEVYATDFCECDCFDSRDSCNGVCHG